MVFFAWGGVGYSLLLIMSIVLNYIFGRAIAAFKQKRLFLALGVMVNLIFIAIFKYAGFLTETLNAFLGFSDIALVKVPKIVLPIGISFYTFQAISYLIDLYRNEVTVQKNIANLGLFISLFPQLIAGPIVRYHDISRQINQREHSSELFSKGVIRFVLGLAKKVLIANNMAVVADHVFGTQASELSGLAAWIGLIAYAFQIYYDFAGYSDMAIGLSKMFGFRLLENFNFPYISKSIQEFWRRWHISLSSWFRDYLYIPLGGNRKGTRRTYINLFIVFFVAGLWHGASWNFVVWGLVHGVFIVIERLGLKKILAKAPGILSGIYTFLVATLAWVLFRADSFEYAATFYKALFGIAEAPKLDINLILLINREFIYSLIIAIIGAFGGFVVLQNQLLKLKSNLSFDTTKIEILAKSVFIIIIMVLSTIYLANSTYNPFIYFRF